MTSDDLPLLCHHCGAQVEPGRAECYVVRIEAFADPSPPSFTDEDLERHGAGEIDRLIETLRGLSEQEAMDQVYRKMTIYLCNACYRRWIENPTGS
jgi:hypothetical protein